MIVRSTSSWSDRQSDRERERRTNYLSLTKDICNRERQNKKKDHVTLDEHIHSRQQRGEKKVRESSLSNCTASIDRCTIHHYCSSHIHTLYYQYSLGYIHQKYECIDEDNDQQVKKHLFIMMIQITRFLLALFSYIRAYEYTC